MTRLSGLVLVEEETDGSVGALAGSADEGAEDEVRQRVEKHLHTDNLCGDDAGVGGVDHDAAVAQALGKVEGEEGDGQLGVAIDGDAPEAALAATLEEVGEVQMADAIDT